MSATENLMPLSMVPMFFIIANVKKMNVDIEQSWLRCKRNKYLSAYLSRYQLRRCFCFS